MESQIDWGERWATRLYTVRNPLHAQIRDDLVELAYAAERLESDRSAIATLAKRGLFESGFDLLERDVPAIKSLRAFCEQAVLEIVTLVNGHLWPEELRVRVNIDDSWVHVTRDGGYHDVHTHPMCSWCGIYYVDIGDSTLRPPNGVNRFYEPRANAAFFNDHGTWHLREETCVDMPPEDGALIVFPSYLRHSAVPYRGTRARIVIAFNTTIREVSS